MKPEISVIIPTYNRAHTLPETLQSVLDQSFVNWECLIVDDGSSDDTRSAISSFLLKDKRFVFIERPADKEKGAAACRNIGLEAAKGKYIQFLDSDDLIAANKLQSQLEALKKISAQSIATCKWGRMKPRWNVPQIYKSLPSYNSTARPEKLLTTFGKRFTYFPLHVYLIPLNLIRKAGVWNETLSVNDDGEFICRIILNASEITFVQNTYVIYKQGAGNRLNGALTTEGIKSYIEAWQLIEENIFQNTGIENHILVRQAKHSFFERIKTEFPEVVLKYKDFFASKMTRKEYVYLKVRNRIINEFST
ncbi:glycosyltransferase family 2 protein [Zunongwangia sp. H14]|uniref:glycosyltransferase family 2 protein n=1 Tax=Zunongwangia sp. H14 TaxID=3240792 RepID=UPI00356AC89E